MIPSRGLRWSSQTIGIGRRRLETYSARQFSSSTVQHDSLRPVLLQRTQSNLARANTQTQFSKTRLLLRNGAGIRFASTAPVPAAPATPEATNPSSITTPLDDTFNFATDSILNAPEHIGYLKSLGLDFGWGFTSTMEWVLEHVHIFAGTPWWASITMTAVLIRIILFRGYVGASENSTRVATIQPITKPIRDKMTAAARMKDSETMMKCRQELAIINKRAGINNWYLGVPFIQALLGFGSFRLLNAMSKLPVPGLETGGALWFYDLTIPDPLFILPLCTATLLHLLLRRGGELGIQTMTPQVLNAMKWGLPAMTLLFTSWLPAAVQLTFLVGGTLSFGQASLLRQIWFRRFFNMTALPTPRKPGESSSSPYKGKLKVAPNPVLSQAELSSRFQGASPGPGLAKSENSGLVSKVMGGAVKDIQETVKSVKTSATELVGRGKKQVAERISKQELKERQKYEKQRAEELRREKWEMENEKRAERAQRKMQGR